VVQDFVHQQYQMIQMTYLGEEFEDIPALSRDSLHLRSGKSIESQNMDNNKQILKDIDSKKTAKKKQHFECISLS